MKKIRIMLISFAFIALAGGALAFKAKCINCYCITATSGSTCPTGLACLFKAANVTTTNTGPKYCTAICPEGGSCAGVVCGNFAPTSLANND